MHFNREFDGRGSACFMLTLRTKKFLDDMKSGEVLKITTRDPGSVNDFTAYAAQTGSELLSSNEAGGEYVIFLRKH